MCVIFMCSMSASPPRHSLWHTGQLVALGPPMRELCCWNTTRCCSSFFGGACSTDARRQTGRSIRASPHQDHHHTTTPHRVTRFSLWFFSFFNKKRFGFGFRSIFVCSVEPPGIAAWPEDEPQRGGIEGGRFTPVETRDRSRCSVRVKEAHIMCVAARCRGEHPQEKRAQSRGRHTETRTRYQSESRG